YDSDDYHGHYVCGQGHFDSRVPHAGTGYECTKAEAEEIFGDAFNWYVYPDYFDLDNESGSEPDDCTTDTDDSPYHNGSATAITWTECSNVGAEGTDHHHEGPADGC
ncbi:MAG: hypothetical protein ACOCT0_05840, partial [Halobacteriota archaeon]